MDLDTAERVIAFLESHKMSLDWWNYLLIALFSIAGGYIGADQIKKGELKAINEEYENILVGSFGDRVNNTPLHFLFRAKKEADIEDERIFQTFGFRSKKAARMVCKDLESLRNNLAPAQDIAFHAFTQAARMPRALHRCTAIKQEAHAFPAFAKRGPQR
ncbi:hypothetical protein [Desulfobulbus sp.]|uniref:hypothetical protein n=1 Tax=Desulfobulbus sp. TaxID=895 RepID=UPI0027B96F33|nr:hypothetical protein [Desulfobulbus sp.]